ncbi:MAG: nucleotidyl transferase AbiEii/AbiGii toxin family protein [Caulobacterales bacterium]|nr:nucleotidyl transferase AbiEii/AbiGii toxin family protein [Caulobacterales bacterium]MCA0373607.1 nucleotidyl transferase AbiEii/AbiGii toxin family protein [Pseudomonadota bacterium]
MHEKYKSQVRLLLDVLPYVAKEKVFALKGGTAINLFERNLPRLSVDIDLTFLSMNDRATALTSISEALLRIKGDIESHIKNVRITLVEQGNGVEAKLHCQRGRTQIKIEVNPVLRGNLLPIRKMTTSQIVQDEFEAFIQMQVLAQGELYGGKICAALDRQHPRDLFDVRLLLDNEGINNEIKTGFLAGLLSHGRPLHEMLRPTFKDQKAAFQNQFSEMTQIKFDYDDFEKTRTELVEAVSKSLNENDKAFLLSFKSGEPDWLLCDNPLLKTLPAIDWKLNNINKLKSTNSNKHNEYLELLKENLQI